MPTFMLVVGYTISSAVGLIFIGKTIGRPFVEELLLLRAQETSSYGLYSLWQRGQLTSANIRQQLGTIQNRIDNKSYTWGTRWMGRKASKTIQTLLRNVDRFEDHECREHGNL